MDLPKINDPYIQFDLAIYTKSNISLIERTYVLTFPFIH